MLKGSRRDVYLADMPDSDTEDAPERSFSLKLSWKDFKILNNTYNAKNLQKYLPMRKPQKIKKLSKTARITKKKNAHKNKININVSNAGSSVVPYQQQYQQQNQELCKFPPTNHT